MHNINTFEGGAGGDWLPTLHQKRLSKSMNLSIAEASGLQVFKMTDVFFQHQCVQKLSCIVNPH